MKIMFKIIIVQNLKQKVKNSLLEYLYVTNDFSNGTIIHNITNMIIRKENFWSKYIEKLLK